MKNRKDEAIFIGLSIFTFGCFIAGGQDAGGVAIAISGIILVIYYIFSV